MAVRSSPISATEPVMVISRVFDALRRRVFGAWTDPKQFSRWWGPKDFTNPVCEIDLRPGGAYRITMHSPDGVDYPLKGTYLEVVAPKRLVMTIDTGDHPAEWHELFNQYRGKGKGAPPVQIVMTVTFEEYRGKTTLTIMQHFDSAADRDANLKMGAPEGWAQSLERLTELLA